MIDGILFGAFCVGIIYVPYKLISIVVKSFRKPRH